MRFGIVFKIEGGKAIVLKSDGGFVCTATKKEWEVGQTVRIAEHQHKGRIKLMLILAASLAVVVIGGFGFNAVYSSPVSIISLDVNPSIELSVNRFGKIASADALNNEGEQILAEINMKNTTYSDALKSILEAESKSGYLTADTSVVLTVFSSDTAVQASLLSELQGLIDSQILIYSNQITAEYHAVDEHTVKGAHGHGVTAGKYLYLRQLRELAPETDISQYANDSIEQLKGDIEECRQGHGKAEHDSSHENRHRRKRHEGG